MLWAFLRVFVPPWIPEPLIRPFTCIAFIFIIRILTKTKFETVVSAYLFSYGISYSILFLATGIVGLASVPFVFSGNADSQVYDINHIIFLLGVVIIIATELAASYLLFRVKRFRNGFPLLFDKHAVVITLITTGIILFSVTIVTAPNEVSIDPIYFLSAVIGVIAIGIGVIVWVRKRIKELLMKKMKERSVEILEKELAHREDEIRRLTMQSDTMRVANHKVIHRLTVLESSVCALIQVIQDNDISSKVREELSIVADDIKRLSQEYQKGIEQIKVNIPLTTTKIKMIDDMFKYFSKLFADNEIGFNLKVNGSILYMIEHIISQSQLETMIGDLLGNARVAVDAGDNSFRSIFVILGLVDNCYELSVLDSGIPFEPDTLMRLGKGYVTTNANHGGSGIGFMTTFETARGCRGSIIIREMTPHGADFTKSVTVRFDDKNDYIVQTPRADELRALCTEADMSGNCVSILDS